MNIINKLTQFFSKDQSTSQAKSSKSKDKKKIYVQITLNEAQHWLIREASKKVGMSMVAYSRERILEAINIDGYMEEILSRPEAVKNKARRFDPEAVKLRKNITTAVDQETLNLLDSMAKSMNVNRSEALRKLIDLGSTIYMKNVEDAS